MTERERSELALEITSTISEKLKAFEYTTVLTMVHDVIERRYKQRCEPTRMRDPIDSPEGEVDFRTRIQ
jgi:hypothetical protein